MAAEFFTDTRMRRNTRRGLVAQLRQSIYSRLAGYKYTNDAEQLCNDPAMCCLVGGGVARHPAASTSQMGRFEIDVLTQRENLLGLMDLSGVWIDRVRKRKQANKMILGQPGTWPPGRECLQRPLRLCLLSSPVLLQPARRPGAGIAPQGQCP